MEIEKKNQEDSIWTWKKTTSGKAKTSLWIPYLIKFEYSKSKWWIHFNGGSVHLDFSKVDMIMFYGKTDADLPFDVINLCLSNDITLMFYRRNLKLPYIMTGGNTKITNTDNLSKQIIARSYDKKRLLYARTLIRYKFKYIESYIFISKETYASLPKCNKLSDLRAIEADYSRRYWSAYFLSIGQPEINRRDDHVINDAINACCFFLSSIIMRWCIYHKLSIFHGFLHEGINYASLVYDLIEPYRYFIDESVKESYISGKEDSLTGRSIENLKRKLEEKVYCSTTNQYVKNKAFLHGVVLALRSHLVGDSKKFVPPTQGVKSGGRPLKLAYKLPSIK
ncbi:MULTISPECIES: CRISPR-associated endonuclease Cas1 [Cysteiniphilum]|uniref:CRISPR-associated endonuclease Cas1 n=1 Tax=Cysteiniphilum litorale TaxID=2056700 RepID=A0A8J3E819_9GAMM|nr:MULTISPECIES: CRISPR-associated endonuclease Cas1 [Cysteiniphilum]GGF91135.1 hypothetical protein GCM10010995_05520 [Cysteiniphilum litorale]